LLGQSGLGGATVADLIKDSLLSKAIPGKQLAMNLDFDLERL
jgi:hypothetical protein